MAERSRAGAGGASVELSGTKSNNSASGVIPAHHSGTTGDTYGSFTGRPSSSAPCTYWAMMTPSGS